MATNRGATLFVLLLCCWQEAEVQPMNIFSGPASEKLWKSKPQDDIHGIFDEIVVQEFLDPDKSILFETQRPQKKPMKSTKKKATHIKTNDQTDTDKHHEKTFSSGDEDRLFLNEEEKEIFYQIKSLRSLGNIIDSLQRALVNTLKQRRKNHKSLFKGSKHHRVKESLN
ncbi:sperm acrosome-associated protein 7-like [Eptesicus fuscus]|uniref:sperm acrosome-associated protein 7-like n=1 Tax=Eptesicus fuscus TaxID=29078 RepID=UPI00240437F9|nr:sperm acrosome-associated protein 7-like [Eptesicus fuscus]